MKNVERRWVFLKATDIQQWERNIFYAVSVLTKYQKVSLDGESLFLQIVFGYLVAHSTTKRNFKDLARTELIANNPIFDRTKASDFN